MSLLHLVVGWKQPVGGMALMVTTVPLVLTYPLLYPCSQSPRFQRMWVEWNTAPLAGVGHQLWHKIILGVNTQLSVYSVGSCFGMFIANNYQNRGAFLGLLDSCNISQVGKITDQAQQMKQFEHEMWTLWGNSEKTTAHHHPPVHLCAAELAGVTHSFIVLGWQFVHCHLSSDILQIIVTNYIWEVQMARNICI